MKKLIHLSDLHFGTERDGIVDALIADIKQLNPDIIVISGDLTQRAKTIQYQRAKEFLDKIKPYNVLCVPGNHDISLYDIVRRFFYTFSRYKKWISPTLCTHFIQDNIAILGINSVTPFKPMGGYVTQEQLNLVTQFFQQQPDDMIKIIVMHHNLISSERHKIINDAEKIINIFASCKVNLVLSGHIHYACIELLKRSYVSHNLYIITAGTAISTRTAQPNSFNVIEFDHNEFKLSVRAFQSNQFVVREEQVYPL